MILKFNRLATALILVTVASCAPHGGSGDFTFDEKVLINTANSIMRILTIEDPVDSVILRKPSTDLSVKALQSEEYVTLCSLMVATVRHPSQDGVGIAGPQVGLNRRIVAVQRFDKEPVVTGRECAGDDTSVQDGMSAEVEHDADYPFEVYPNVRIVWRSDSLAYGPEGCLSVPGRRGDVLRSQEIVIEYACVGYDSVCTEGCGRYGMGRCTEKGRGREEGGRSGKEGPTCSGSLQQKHSRMGQEGITMVRDTVRGFTAVIFQHEIDHLDGVLYIDRL